MAPIERIMLVVIDASKGDSGLVRSDYYDWAAQVPKLVEEQKPDAILALVGANDRQGISTEAGSQALGTEGPGATADTAGAPPEDSC